VAWIDDQRAAGELSEASIRHNMNLLSRFFSWAIARDKASINPVRQLPMESRPTQTVKSDTPWLDDDAIVRKLISDLEEPISFMFYLCNRSGLRTGEAAGLRMSDMAFVDEGLIRVRFSYDGPLKEDKKGEGKVKWVPAPEDCAEFLGPWLDQRKAQGANSEDRVFPCARRKGLCFRKEYIESCWEEAAPETRRRSRAPAQEKGDKVANEVDDDLTPGHASQLREPSPLARRLARRGQRRRRPLLAHRHEAILRSLPLVLAEAAGGSRSRRPARGSRRCAEAVAPLSKSDLRNRNRLPTR
jgi:hypothetical protein